MSRTADALVSRHPGSSVDPSERDRLRSLEQSYPYELDPNECSWENHLIAILDIIVVENPEKYTGNVYSDFLSPSPVLSNYSSAAEGTSRDPVSNEVRWYLQQALVTYAIEFGLDELQERLEGGAELSFQVHDLAFQWANQQDAIGRLPWRLLSRIDVPAMGESLGRIKHTPAAFFAAVEEALAYYVNTLDSSGANAAFSRGLDQRVQQGADLGDRMISWSIESMNSPHGPESMPWYGRLMRVKIDMASRSAYPLRSLRDRREP